MKATDKVAKMEKLYRLGRGRIAKAIHLVQSGSEQPRRDDRPLFQLPVHCHLERIMTWTGFYGTRLSGSTYTVPRHKLDVFGVSLRRPLSPKGGEGTKKCQFMVRRSIEKQEMLNKPDDNLKVG